MNELQLKNITHKYYQKLKKQFKRIIPRYDPEQIHQFRLIYKKQRAFLRMIAQQDKNKAALQIFRKIKKVYNNGGIIRDLQLQLQQMIKSNKTHRLKINAYLNLLHKKIEKQKKKFPAISFTKRIDKCEKKTDAAIHGYFSLIDFWGYIVNKREEISAIILSGRFIDDDLHDIRKCLKDLFYNLKIYRQLQTRTMPGFAFNAGNDLYMTELLDELGRFHNVCMTIDLLKWYRLNKRAAYKKQRLVQVENNCVTKKYRQKILLIYKLTKDFLPVCSLIK